MTFVTFAVVLIAIIWFLQMFFLDHYYEEMKKAEIKYCDGLDEVTQYCGGKLKRERCGYSGIINNIQYVAERCQ
jgi:hypothetical protein